MLDIGPEKTNVYPIRQTGKRKGQKNVIQICQVRTCDKHGLWLSTMGNSDKLYLCKLHRSMHNRKGPCIDYNDVTHNDSLEHKRNHGYNMYHEIINEYLDDWRKRIKINIVNKIEDCECISK